MLEVADFDYAWDMRTPTGTPISLEEYISTVYDPDREYVDGEAIERNMGEFDHAGLQTAIAALLYGQRREAGIYVFVELRVQTSPTRFRVPDVTVTTRKGKGRILREPPFLCIEILSPEDRVSRMEARIADYLRFGVEFIWLIDPQERRAWTYTREGRRETDDVLATSNPNLTLRLDDVFRSLDEDVERDEGAGKQ